MPRRPYVATHRTLPTTGFRGDRGEADPALAAALSRFADSAAEGAPAPAAETELLAALAAAPRLLVAVVAVPAPGAQHGAEMALVTLSGTDGRRALPGFTSVRAMGAWDGAARPVPVAPAQAARAALDEGADVLVVDVGCAASYAVDGALLRALAAGRPLLPLYDDPGVAAAVRAALADEPAVRKAYLVPAPELDARLVLVMEGGMVDGGVASARLSALAARVGSRLQQAEALRASLVRGLDVALVPVDPHQRRPVYVRASPEGP